MSYEDIPGFSGFLWLYEEWVASATDGAIAVEVGVALGHSIARLAELVRLSGKRITIYAVDPWDGYARNGEQQSTLGIDPRSGGDFRLFLDNMRKHAPRELDMLRVVRATSIQASMMIRRADLVLIDGAHDRASVNHDIEAWHGAVVTDGGILAGDDHEPTYPGVKEACEEWWGAGGYEVRGSTWVKRF